MPRQRISSGHPDDNWAVEIGWSAESPFVQIGVEEVAGFAIVDVLYGQDQDNVRMLGDRLSDAFTLPIVVPDDLAADPDALTEGEAAVRFKERIMTQRGRALLDIVTGSPSNPTGSYTGLWVNLDRAGCNALIQTIRRARDRAFGRDE